VDLFVYGTLRSARLVAAVAGADVAGIAATLDGYRVGPLAGDVVPHIKVQAGAVAEGILYADIAPWQQARLDLFEGAFGYTLIDVSVETAHGTHAAMMYLPPDEAKVGNGQWSLEAWETNHLAPMLHAVHEVFSHDPMLDHATLRRMWPMVEKRAWAKHRAAQTPKAATLRYTPKPGDVDMHSFAQPAGGFFRFDRFQVDHIRFDGQRSGDLPREVFNGTDAAMLLPYDPKTDRILLVEQMRLGPAMRGDPNPWSLEPIAGMVDARETPLEAALREAHEEAGLHITTSEFMMSFYPTPGNTTDFFSCFLGVCDLPETKAYHGGLGIENEDLRLHTLGFAQAMALIDTGEITAGPLITMLYWLDRQRDRLRSTA